MNFVSVLQVTTYQYTLFWTETSNTLIKEINQKIKLNGKPVLKEILYKKIRYKNCGLLIM